MPSFGFSNLIQMVVAIITSTLVCGISSHAKAVALVTLQKYSGEKMKDMKKPTDDELKKKLNKTQYLVTQHEETEPPFKNEFWDSKKEGIYVDIVLGEPLFSSLDKYDSGTGWPSFKKPLVPENITERKDKKFFTTRTEVRSKWSNSHLGHVFDDGPKPTGLRYCMNSASLRFIAKEDLEKEGYGEFVALFKSSKMDEKLEKAILAGGCFWCLQPPYDKLKEEGVVAVSVGYSGGDLDNPTYEKVSHEKTGHKEVIEVTYDSSKISYEKILEIFWKNIDPLDPAGQFCDKGEQYQSAIYYASPDQKKIAEKSKQEIEKKLKNPIATQILPAKKYYPAEDYHQSYYTKNPIRYKYYRTTCGRDQRLKKLGL